MSNILYLPDLNPIRFYDESPAILPQYSTKHFDEYVFGEQLKPWNQRSKYCQKWQTSDTIKLQFQANFSSITIDLIDKYGISRFFSNVNPVRANKFEPGMYAFEVSIPLAGIAEGVYYLKLSAFPKTLLSEPIIVRNSHPNTLLLEYSNTRYHGDVIFETGIQFSFRVEGVIGFMTPGANDVTYEDQALNPSVLSSKTFRSFKLHFGGSLGFPDWVLDKINQIWSCNNVTVDGKSFAKSSESKYDINDTDGYQMRGLTMEVREGMNRGSKIILPDGDPNKRLAVILNIESQVFGDLTNNNTVPISANE